MGWPYQRGHWIFKMIRLSLSKSTVRWKAQSESDGVSLSLMAQGNRCGNRAWAPSQYNSKRCFTEAIVLHTYMHGFAGLTGGSVTSSRAPHQQLAFTTLYSFMKYILTWHAILCGTMETQTSNSVILSQKCYGSWCYSTLLQHIWMSPIKVLS